MELREKYTNSLYAAIAGDALGVPEDSSTNQEQSLISVKNIYGYGRYDQPKGTWSDDSSMILCTMESLCRGYNIEDIANTLCSWLFDGKWTPHGFVFDSGVTTFTALESIRSDKKTPYESGCKTEDDNGNGSLMRIIPAALYFAKKDIADFLTIIHDISAITHAHPRSKIGCGIYSLFLRNLLAGNDKHAAYTETMKNTQEYYSVKSEFSSELSHFDRLLSQTILKAENTKIYSSGYIVHTLETAVWCLMKHETTKEILQAAVNLGLDTDTNGAAAGGLAGLIYGLDSIPEDWITSLVLYKDIDELIKKFVSCIISSH